jgi:hypothetical protein
MTDVKALYKEYIDKMPDNIITKNDIDGYEKEFWRAHKERNKAAAIDELNNCTCDFRRQELLELVYYGFEEDGK